MVQAAAADFTQPVVDGLATVATFIPKLIGFLLILAVGYLIAKAIAKVVDRVLERVGFDNYVERGGIKQALSRSQYDASDILSKIIFYVIFIPFLSAAVGALGIQALQAPLAQFIALLPRIVVALILVVVGSVIASAAKRFIENALGGLSYGRFLGYAAAGLILLGFVKSALDQVGIATTVTGPVLNALLFAAAGIAIVGVGGGLIKPMQHRLEDALRRASDEAQTVKLQAQANAGTATSGAGAASQPYPTTGGSPAGSTAGSSAATSAYPTSGGASGYSR